MTLITASKSDATVPAFAVSWRSGVEGREVAAEHFGLLHGVQWTFTLRPGRAPPTPQRVLLPGYPYSSKHAAPLAGETCAALSMKCTRCVWRSRSGLPVPAVELPFARRTRTRCPELGLPKAGLFGEWVMRLCTTTSWEDAGMERNFAVSGSGNTYRLGLGINPQE